MSRQGRGASMDSHHKGDEGMRLFDVNKTSTAYAVLPCSPRRSRSLKLSRVQNPSSSEQMHLGLFIEFNSV